MDERREFERLKEDGHEFVETHRGFEVEMKIENVRRTQLFRTLPHEFGHYVHYLGVVERPGREDEAYEVWEERWEGYDRIPKVEKEKFAHAYADGLKLELESLGI